MAQSYEFAIIRFAPDDGRDERLNIGLAVFQEDGLDIRVSRRLEKTRALSAALDVDVLRDLLTDFSNIDQRMRDAGNLDASARKQFLSAFGPVKLSESGKFAIDSQFEYEDRISSILRSFVDPEPALPRSRRKSTRLMTQMKTEFRRERVLAKKDENIESHRIVPDYELDQGLVADFVLRNGAMHIVETVDASNEEASLRRAISDIAVSALVLERGRMKFGDSKTNSVLVYNASSSIEKIAKPSLDAAEHQGANLVNWASATQRAKFINSLSMLATPIVPKARKKSMKFIGGPRFDI